MEPENKRTKATLDLLDEIHVIDPDTVRVEDTVGDGVTVQWGDRRVEGVSARPCYPVTRPHRCIFLCDGEGQEIGVLEDLRDLDPRSRAILEGELAKQHFTPRITRVDAVYREFHIPVWEVQTDRGPRRLELKSRRDVHRLPNSRVYIRDAEGNGYLIPDLRKLDPASRRLVELDV
jgi:hypothetical protein